MRTGRADWNDQVQQFIKIKIEKPYILKELLQLQSASVCRKSTSQKQTAYRQRYQQLSNRFRREQGQLERKLQIQKQLKKSILMLNSLAQPEKTETQIKQLNTQASHIKNEITDQQDHQTSQTCYSLISHSHHLKRREQLADLLANYVNIKDSIIAQNNSLRTKQLQLKQAKENASASLQQLLLENQKLILLIEKKDMFIQLQKNFKQSRLHNIELIEKLSQIEQKIVSRSQKKRQCIQNQIKLVFQKLLLFQQQCQQIFSANKLSSTESLLKLKQKYGLQNRINTLQHQFQLDRAERQNQETSHSSFKDDIMAREKSLSQEFLKNLNEIIKVKTVTQTEFQQLKNDCIRISLQTTQLQTVLGTLNAQIDYLKDNLRRKNVQIQRARVKPQTTK